MLQTVEVDVTPDLRAFIVRGGAHRGGDDLHRLVSSWPGWRRLPASGNLPGFGPCSIYKGPAWASSVIPLLNSTIQGKWSDKAREFALSIRKRMQTVQALLANKDKLFSQNDPDAYPTKRKPFAHQARGAEAIAVLDCKALLGDDMGIGKTSTVLWAWWCGPDEYKRLLVLCPKSSKYNWREEIRLTLANPEDLPVFVIDGTPKQRDVIIQAIKADQHAWQVVVINYDLMQYLSEPQWEWLRAWPDSMICDESHYLKSIKTERTKLVMEICQYANPEFRVLMSGTPIRNMVDDLFAQSEIIHPGTWASYADFCNRHMVMVPMNFANMPKYKKVQIPRGSKNLDQLNAVMNTFQIRRMKEEVTDMPPKSYSQPLLELDGPYLQVYKEMKEFALIELRALMAKAKPNPDCEECKGSGLVSQSIDEPLAECGCTAPAMGPDALAFSPMARSAVEAAMRCEQLAQGFLTGIPDLYYQKVAPLLTNHAEKVDGYPGAFAFPGSPKLQWLQNTLEELQGKQLVVFSRFNAPLIWLAKRYTESGLLIGATSALQRSDLIESFQSGKIGRLFCQVKIAEGFSLTAARDVVFLGRDWSAAMNSQAEDRCHRIGQKGTVNIQIPLVINSVERLIDRKLKIKASDAEQALVTIRDLMEEL
jgi:SNF2 family DNA or RNA helicase